MGAYRLSRDQVEENIGDFDAHPHRVVFTVGRHKEVYEELIEWLSRNDARGTYYKDITDIGGTYAIVYAFQDYGTAFYVKMKYA